MAWLTCPSSRLLLVFLLYMCWKEIVNSQVIYRPCESYKGAVNLCNNTDDVLPFGFLSYDSSSDPQTCSCEVSTSREAYFKIHFASSYDEDSFRNGSFDDVLEISATFNGSWQDSISRSKPWRIQVSTQRLPLNETVIEGFCFTYETNTNTTVMSIACNTDKKSRSTNMGGPTLIVFYIVFSILTLLVIVIICLFAHCRQSRGKQSITSASVVKEKDENQDASVMGTEV